MDFAFSAWEITSDGIAYAVRLFASGVYKDWAECLKQELATMNTS